MKPRVRHESCPRGVLPLRHLRWTKLLTIVHPHQQVKVVAHDGIGHPFDACGVFQLRMIRQKVSLSTFPKSISPSAVRTITW